MPGNTADQGSWRDVSPRTYKRLNLVSTVVGTLVFAWGLWRIGHFRIASGLFLVAVGSIIALWTAALRIEGTPAALYRPDHDPTTIHAGRRAHRAEVWTPRVVHFYTRKDCALCDEARIRLEKDLEGAGVTVVDHDVDEDPALADRFGDRVPVAVHEGDELFALRYDPEAVADRFPGTRT